MGTEGHIYTVLVSGPKPHTVPVRALNKEAASAKALRVIEMHPDVYGEGKFKVERVIGPDDE